MRSWTRVRRIVLWVACGLSSVMPLMASAQLGDTIIGGGEVAVGDPVEASAVALRWGNGFVCSGVVVDDDLILTAAHCIGNGGRGLRAVFALDSNQRGAPSREIVGAEVPPQWGTVTRGNDRYDIGLLRFKGGIPAGHDSASFFPMTASLTQGQAVIVAGYGSASSTQTQGTGILRKAEVAVANPRFARMEVTLDQTGGRGACFGDSGSPGYVVRGGKLQVFGVTNRGIGAPECQGQVVYQLINPHFGWLVEAAARLRATRK